MLAVHKFAVQRGDRNIEPVPMPLGAKPLHVAADPKTGETAMWALVDTNMPAVEVFCAWIWTGKPVPSGVQYVGSHLVDGWEMRHVFIGPTDAKGCVTADDQVIANKMANRRLG